jgi:hypothetical protein
LAKKGGYLSMKAKITKKAFAFLLTMVMAVTALPVVALGSTPSQQMQGRSMGYVLHTDIRSFINGVEIRGYNLAGHVFVIAEDLRAYGFNVTWDGSRREINVTTPAGIPAVVPHVYPVIIPTAGTPIFRYYHSDIIAAVNGIRVPSYNIGNLTLIRLQDAVIPNGRAVWDPANRELRAYTDSQQAIALAYVTPFDDGRHSFSLYTAAINGAPFADIVPFWNDYYSQYYVSLSDDLYTPALRFHSGLGNVVLPDSPRTVTTLQRLRGEFSLLTGVIGREDGSAMIPATVEIWGDGRLLFGPTQLSATALPTEIQANVSGVDLLRIDVTFPRGSELQSAIYAIAADLWP